jgi:hypothetical protein
MDRKRDKLAVEDKLARCRELAKEFKSEPAATHLREMEAELPAQLRALEK